MPGWDYQEYLNGQIKEIEDLKRKGFTEREILDTNEFCFTALKTCGLPISYLIPTLEGQDMTLQEWDTHTSAEHKWEYWNETCFGEALERDRILIGLLYNAGLKRFWDILPKQSKEELFYLINNHKNE